MIPGQLGPSMRVLLWVLSMSVMRTMSCCGIPSVMVTTRGTSAAMASSILAAASGGGTKMAEASAPVALRASSTLLKTGLPKCSLPAFLGLVPPTTLVPSLLYQRVASATIGAGPAYRTRWPAGRGNCGRISIALVEDEWTATYVPCLPVKPWNRTLVSLLMRRLTLVEA